MGVIEEAIRAAIGYDPITGAFWWIVPPKMGPSAHLSPGDPCGGYNALGYLKIRFRGRRYYAHRIAWLIMTGDWPEADVDHENRKPFDNRWFNLRAATHTQNMANRKVHTNNTSGVSGVYPHHGKWRVSIQANKKRHYIGDFETIEAASIARNTAALRFHGDFAQGV